MFYSPFMLELEAQLLLQEMERSRRLHHWPLPPPPPALWRQRLAATLARLGGRLDEGVAPSLPPRTVAS